MMCMMRFSFGAVILVPFPFTDQSTNKKRPAVVISSAAYAETRPDLILMAITSQLRAEQRVDEFLVEQWKEAGLLKPSAVKPVIATIEQPLIIRQLGELTESDQAVLRQLLRQIIG